MVEFGWIPIDLEFAMSSGELWSFDEIASTFARYMYRGWPPSQGWRTFLTNYVDGIAAIDLFVLPTITFRLLYCLVVLRHGRDCGYRSG